MEESIKTPEPRNEEEREFARKWYLAGMFDSLDAYHKVLKSINEKK